jgi:hypothetical protein
MILNKFINFLSKLQKIVNFSGYKYSIDEFVVFKKVCINIILFSNSSNE